MRRGAKVYFINRYFYPDQSATSQMLCDLAFALSARGYRVSVITSRMLYDDASRLLERRERFRDIEIIRLPTTRFGRSNLIGRAIDYLTFYLSLIGVLFRQIRARDVVIAKTDPPMLSICVAPLVWLKRARLVNWLQDIFPEVATELGMGRGFVARNSFAALRWLRNKTLKAATSNVVLGERMAARIEDQGISKSQITVIPNWADGRAIVPIGLKQNRLRDEWGLSDAFVVGYSGNLGRAHEIETLLEAATLIESGQFEQRDEVAPNNQADHKRVHWLFIGSGAQTDRLKQLVEERGLRSFSFKPYQPRDQLAQSLSVADVHLVSLRPALEGLIVPSKYYGIAAAGRPAIFIGDRDGEIARILSSCDGGLSVDEGDAQTLAAVIMNLAREPHWAERMGCNARAYFDEHFDKQCAIASWQDVLERAGVSGALVGEERAVGVNNPITQ